MLQLNEVATKHKQAENKTTQIQLPWRIFHATKHSAMLLCHKQVNAAECQ